MIYSPPVRFITIWLLAVGLSGLTPGQTPSQLPGPEGYASPGMTRPKLIRKQEPKYTSKARDARVQGSVVFEIVIGVNGKPLDPVVISPLGFGLDEAAREAIEQWQFKPAEKDGVPVPVRAVIQVNFRFPEIYYDSKEEQRRTTFNMALRDLDSKDAKRMDAAVATMQDLSKQKFPAAMHRHALLIREGKLPGDEQLAVKLLQGSAEKHYGPAIFEIGRMHMTGSQLPLDHDKGLEMVREAAVLGSVGAQLFLAMLYQEGKSVPRDLDRARRYLRLCAAAGAAVCQMRLADLLLTQEPRPERDYVQAIAWLQLASEAGFAGAAARLEKEDPKLSSEQTKWVANLKEQLVRRQ